MRKAVFTPVSLAVLTFVSLIAALPAWAQTPQLCGLREDMGKMLAQRFGEQPKAAGLVGDSRVVELLVSQTGSWTILITTSDGRSCVVTGGEDWIDKPASATAARDDTT